MRRPRPHRLTGSVRRLLAAAVLAVLGAAALVTATSALASAAGLPAGLSPPPTLPSATPSAPSPSAPTLPGGASLPNLCPPNCTGTNPGGGPPTNSRTAPGSNRAAGSPTGGTARSSSGALPQFGGAGSGDASSATSTVGAPQSVGLSLPPPPPVEQLTPLAGISFGQAPYLWPLVLLLDVIAAGAVFLVVRRTWSPTAGVD